MLNAQNFIYIYSFHSHGHIKKNDKASKYNELMNELKILMYHFFPWLIYARLICFYIDDTHRLIFISNKNQSESHCKSIWARKFDMIVISAPTTTHHHLGHDMLMVME